VKRRSALAALFAGGVALATAFGLVHCAQPKGGDPGGECACRTGEIVDPTLLAFLGKARAAHHRADLAQEDGDVDVAIAALEPVAHGPRPNAPEAIEVVADTLARLADLKSDLGQHEAALADVEAGLTLADKPSHFRGHLLETKGVVLERRYRTLDAMGETEAAASFKARALDAFKAAIDVQDQVINDALLRRDR
jgi:tetratricopeptide (TPR) repeat protein